MTRAERFELWLGTEYISPSRNRPITTGRNYSTGLDFLNTEFQLTGDGIYERRITLEDLERIRQRIFDLRVRENNRNKYKDPLSHLNAFILFRQHELEIETRAVPPLFRQPDAFKKQQVETAAINTTITHFEKKGYSVISKETDNLGWDLEATNEYKTLLIEVKGLSGNTSSVEVTPNEYKNFTANTPNYLLCIVTDALRTPKLEIFSFNSEQGFWMNELNEKLIIEERKAARIWKE